MHRSELAKRSTWIRSFVLWAVFAVPVLAWIPRSTAQYAADQPTGGTPQTGLPDYLKHAGIAQNLNRKLPLKAEYRNTSGNLVPLGRYFAGKPVVLIQVYFNCGMLCPQVLHGAADSLKQTGLQAGKDYDIVVASFDPQDTPQAAAGEKLRFLQWLGNPSEAPGVHFLTGAQPSIDALTEATGFHYVRVPGPDGKMDQFAHSSVIMVATPDGRLSKYFSGIQYAPRDLRLALVDASDHKIGTASDLFLLYCCSYNPGTGKYTVAILRVLGLAGMITIFIVMGMLYLLTRKPTGRKFPPDAPTSA